MFPRSLRLSLPFCLAGMAGLVHAAPLTFDAALAQAERQYPSLIAQHAQLDAAQAAAVPAGALPDPKLLFGVENFPVSGPMRGSLTGDFMTAQKVGVIQEFPSGAKRRARVESAGADIELAEAQNQLAQLTLRRDVALAWLNRYTLERKLAVFDELTQENRLFATAVRSQIASGRAQAVDAVAPQQEAAQLADRRDELERDLAKARAELHRLLGAAGDEPLAGNPPDFHLDAAQLRQHLQHHPELVAATAQSHKAEAEVHAAEADKHPDWGVELAYQKRGAQFGNMVSVQFTVDLPVFSGSRQEPMIAAKRHELDKAYAEQDLMERDHRNELEAALAELTQLDRQLERVRSQWLPLAQQKVVLASAGYQAGKNGVDAIITARRERLEQRLRLIDLEGQRAGVAAKLYYAYGENTQ